jgi:hypothetical protein
MSYLGGGPGKIYLPPPGGSIDLSQMNPATQAAIIGSGMKNRLYNGNFRVNQRGSSFIIGTAGVVQGQVTSDTWRLNSTAGARVDCNGIQFSLSRDSGSGITEVFSRIAYSDWWDMAGGPATLSFDLYRTVNGTSAQSLQAAVMTTDGESNFTNGVVAMSKTFTNSANSIFERFSLTGNLAAGQQGIYIDFINTNPGSVANNAYLILRNVQFEAGSIATPFERRPFVIDLLNCQRQYAQNPQTLLLSWVMSNYGFLYQVPMKFPVTMRAVPTVTIAARTSVRNIIASSDGVGSITADGFNYQVQQATIATIGSDYGTIQFNGYTASAEL